MPSLRQLLADHAPLLVLDAASARVQIGWFGSSDPADARWAIADEEAGTGVFHCVEKLGVDVRRARAFVFCDGPGSVLGIRTVAMALRAWCVVAPRPIFAYCGLAVVAESLGRNDLTVIADARRELWHAFVRGGQLRRIPATELSGNLVMPEHFRHWSALPAGARVVSYAFGDLIPQIADASLFKATVEPDAFLHEEPAYAAWTPQVHRAPGAK